MVDNPEVTENKVKEFIYKPLLAVNEAEVALQNFKNSKVFKGEVEQKKVRFPAELGEEHPFNFSVVEGIYKKFGMINGVVNKFIDFVIGPGFHVEGDESRLCLGFLESLMLFMDRRYLRLFGIFQQT